MHIDGCDGTVAEPELRGLAEPAESDASSSVEMIFSAREVRLWAGCSEGTRCDLCQRDIPVATTEYEVEAEISDQPLRLHFHIACYLDWRRRRR
jgi:hypothetical protein